MKKLNSLTIFFPFYNDEGTVKKAIHDAYFYGNKLAKKLEVIAIHGGNSKDATFKEILKQKKTYKDLVIIDKSDNWESYAVIKYGFMKASSNWVFYTDGDLQYNLADLEKLVKLQERTGADIANGFKIVRGDNMLRVFLGGSYKIFSKIFFRLPIDDLTCDFRLIRRDFLKKITLEAHDASILLELVKKLEFAGAKFAQIGVGHYNRQYGSTTYNMSKLLKERVIGDLITCYRLISKNNKKQQ